MSGMNSHAEIRLATPKDGEQIRALLPRLANFELPRRRNPEDLWRGDEAMLLNWLQGAEPDLFAFVAERDEQILGTAIVRLRSELLSHEPSAHLEVIVTAAAAEGKGIASGLLREAEREAKNRGAQTLTLHVFANNTRARGLYEKFGYDGELIRYIKTLD